ncbi:MAG: peroxidase, partial [Bacteroidota bacterium]
TNDCLYCQTHHGEALNHFWKDQTKIDQLVADFEQSQLSATDLELCRLAQRITASPNQGTAGAHFTELRKLEVSDRLLLDAMLVIAYFNFVNRLVLGLGVQLEENPGGYEYE